MKNYLLLFFLSSISLIASATNSPVLNSPANGATNKMVYLYLDWYSVSGNQGYIYQIDTTSGFNSPALLSGATSQNSSGVYVNSLYFGKTYYWRAATIGSSDTSTWSMTWHFSTIDFVYNYSPSNGSQNRGTYVNINWYAVNGNTGYIYQYDTVPTFNSPALFQGNSSTNTSNTYINNLRYGTTYYWRVAAKNAVDTSGWGATWHFSTIDFVYNYSPSNGSQNRGTYVNINWYAVDGNTGYIYQYDTVPTFNSPALFQGNSSTNTSNTYINNLRYGTTYYWRVAVKNNVDTSGWGTTWNFSTIDFVYNVSPFNGSQDRGTYVNIDWYAVDGNMGYIYQYDTVPTFNSPALVQGNASINSSHAYINNLRYGTTYYWRAAVKNNVDTSGWGATWNFSTIDFVYNVSPFNGSQDRGTYVNIDWYSVDGNMGYIYQYDTVPTFNSQALVQGNTSTNSSHVYINNLRYGTTYYWRAAVKNNVDTSGWGAVWSFSTFSTLLNYSPSNNSVNKPLNLTIDWESYSGNLGYLYQVDITPDFNSSQLLSGNTSSSSQKYLTNLLYGTTYYWRVAAYNASDTSDWNTEWNFTTLYQMTVAPSLILPLNNASNMPLSNIALSWSSVLTASAYEVEYSTNSSFTSPVNSVTTSSTSTTIGGLSYNVTYYWRVRAVNSSGNSPWSTIRNFSTQIGCSVNASFISASNIYCQGDTAQIVNQTTGASSYSWYVNNNMVSTSSNPLIVFGNSGYYTIKLIASDGNCSDSSSGFFVVNPIYSIFDTINICRGESYTFPDGFLQTNIVTSMNHTSYLNSQSGCDSTIHTALFVTTVDTSVYVAGTILIANANNNATYQWLDCQNNIAIVGETSKSFIPTSSGSYAVEVQMNSCKDTSFCHTVLIDGFAGFVNSNNVVIFPNPAREIVNIKFENSTQDVEIFLRSIDGKILMHEFFETSSVIKLEVGSVPAGCYFLHISTADNSIVKRLIINQGL